MFKKLLSSLVTVGLFSSLVMGIGFAESEKQFDKVVFKAEAIIDPNLLYERAKNNISDLNADDQKALHTEIKVSDHNNKELSKDKYQSEILTTAQKLEERISGDKKIETYALTSFFMVSSTKSDSAYDSTYSVKSYSTVYYDKVYDSNNLLHYKLTRVTGGWTIDDSSVQISSKKVTYGASGQSSWGGPKTQSKTEYPSSFTFDYTAPSTWVPIASTKCYVGVTTDSTLKRGTSTWNFQFVNNIK